MDATFDHILPLAQSRMPASFGMDISNIEELFSNIEDIIIIHISTANIVDTVIKDCMDLNIAEQLC